MNAAFTPVADHALLIAFGDQITDAAHQRVLALDKAIATNPPEGVVETVPALVNLLVSFDPLITDHQAVRLATEALLKHAQTETRIGQTRTVKVCYEAPFSADLAAVAQATDLSQEAVINAHLAGDYKVLMYGFAPGYAYLSDVAPSIQVPRKPAAIRDVAAGSVIIAGPQCLITTLKMPTGWSILGRSPTPVLTGDPDHPFLFDVGDHVRFERISLTDFDRAAHG